MDELQADFAVGMGTLDVGSSSAERTLHYANGGKPLVVIYRGGKAVEVRPGT
jgi:serine phosphatase RsbU (regulator of sigma subunit)